MQMAPCLAPCVNDSNVMALHSPYATVMWDYINRGMPINKEGTLTPDEVYSLVAFLLYKNGVIKEDDVLDAQSLPKVQMPNRDGFALPPEWKHAALRGFLRSGREARKRALDLGEHFRRNGEVKTVSLRTATSTSTAAALITA